MGKHTLLLRFLTAIVLVGLILTALLWAERWQTDREQQRQLSAKATDLEQVFRQFAVLPTILASDPRLVSVLRNPVSESVDVANRVLRHAAENSDAAFAFLLDQQGVTIAASNYQDEVSFVGQNYSFRPYFAESISGNQATFFAVGATTGIPGYFVSEPVVAAGQVLGVIVVKLEPQQLPVSWREGDAIAVVTDNMGVTILSTDSEMLYLQTRSLATEELELIQAERRYPVSTQTGIKARNARLWVLATAEQSIPYRVRSQTLTMEPWTLSLMTPMAVLYRSIFWNFLIVTGVCLFGGLLWQNYRQQSLLAIERARVAENLEKLVAERTAELRDAQQTLVAESNFAMLGRMSSAINHEINQPLASLRLNLASLRTLVEREKYSSKTEAQSTHSDQDSIESTVVDLDRTAKRITRVIETLRSLPQQNKSGFVSVDVEQWLVDSVQIIQQERSALSRFLSYELAWTNSTKPQVKGQFILLQQALMNLLYNALDSVADEPHPQVVLEAASKNQRLIVKVVDNGAGVERSVEKTLFEPFQSGNSKTGGMGLGLTLARQILVDHGGTLAYSRESHHSSDARTVFTLTLPLMDASPEQQN